MVLEIPDTVDLLRIVFVTVGLVTVLSGMYHVVWNVFADPFWSPTTMKSPDNWETTASIIAWLLLGLIGIWLTLSGRYLSEVLNGGHGRNNAKEGGDVETS